MEIIFFLIIVYLLQFFLCENFGQNENSQRHEEHKNYGEYIRDLIE